MKVTVKIKGAGRELNPKVPALIVAKGKAISPGTVEWTLDSSAELTSREIDALKRKHKSQCPNLQRATEVKQLMRQGKRRREIVALLHRRYGERMISADHATLSAVGEGQKK